jgi:hypothetical protein
LTCAEKTESCFTIFPPQPWQVLLFLALVFSKNSATLPQLTHLYSKIGIITPLSQHKIATGWRFKIFANLHTLPSQNDHKELKYPSIKHFGPQL